MEQTEKKNSFLAEEHFELHLLRESYLEKVQKRENYQVNSQNCE